MKLQGLRDEIFDTMYDAVKEAIATHANYATSNVITVDGNVCLYVNKKGSIEAEVEHADNNHVSKNLEAFCVNVLRGIDWANAQKEVAEEFAEFEEYQKEQLIRWNYRG